ncbi:unnamed protein product [Rotaria sp. Silwood1]|nr:unnamed protein product [Rotaria sp. Silwood1]CAF3458046.1 unnamed protein product [Rotaria sp. Silwood1]CAF3509052.1 unnamed protein product [Rotaria sp. Silwood1]CAF3522159.1 unnamed protein product [Rotaria sp. Silwood1]CAF4615545.1 unnamed protein product [Rotaria sp. Silwood1]
MGNRCTRPKTKDDIYSIPRLRESTNKSTVKINLSGNNLTDRDIPDRIEEAMRETKYELSLSRNRITSDGVEKLVNFLKTKENVAHLDLSSNTIGDDAIDYIVDLIRNNKSISHLSLQNTNITNRGVVKIKDVLVSNPTSIRFLDLRSNEGITDSSVEAFLEIAEKNKTLSGCYLDGCGLARESKKLVGAQSIQWYLHKNT